MSNKGVIPGGDGVGVGGTNINLRDIFDEASLFVNDLNELVSLDITDLPTNSKHDAAPSMNAVSGGRGGSGDTASVYSNFSTDSQEAHTFHLDEFTNLIGNHYQHASGSTSPVLQLSRNRDIKRQDFEVSNSSLVQQTIQKNNLSGPHASYLQILTNTELSYHMYPFASSVESNEVVHILLEYLIHCPYLLTLLLAISATLQYNQTGKLIHDLSRQKYVSACLTLLSKEFNTSGEGKNNVTLANGIERLLLTVLVLTTNFTASANKDDYGRDNSNNNKDGILNSWKTHLKGAKDLLIRYSNVKSQSKDVTGVSPGLAVAKIWFFAIECLAGLMSPMGGSLTRRNLGDNRENPDGKYKLFEDTGFLIMNQTPSIMILL